MTQHRCTEELRQLREDASHETTSRTKHWGSPSKNQALGELTPESKLDSADPRSPQKFASRRRWSLAPARGLRTSLRSQHGHTSVEPPTAGRAARFKTFYSIFYYC